MSGRKGGCSIGWCVRDEERSRHGDSEAGLNPHHGLARLARSGREERTGSAIERRCAWAALAAHAAPMVVVERLAYRLGGFAREGVLGFWERFLEFALEMARQRGVNPRQRA
jgi:hypothetical protein